MSSKTTRQFRRAVRRELENNLIPFWLERVIDREHGGFIGRMSNDGTVDPTAAKGLILNTRLLWTYSALHQFYREPRFREMAERAYDYLETYFVDRSHGGVFWRVDFKGRLLDDKKKIYGQAFYIYSLAEYHQASGSSSALQSARDVFERIEGHSHDPAYQGYIEVCNRDWSLASDSRLSDSDMNEKKSMNNHLHLLESYSNLYRLWPDTRVQERLREVIDLFCQQIADPGTGHLRHFFDERWQPKSADYTFGHDIEASWLLVEAAEVVGDPDVASRAQRLALRLARTALAEGFDDDGGLCYRGEAGRVVDRNREWWPQAESVVGFLNAYELCGERLFLEAALKAWAFIEKHFVDREHGDWFWRVDPAGRPDPAEPKVSEWKEPYHGVRACLEAVKRLKRKE